MKPTLFQLGLLSLGLCLLGCPILSHAQTSPLLQITSLEVIPGNPVQFTFSDGGTGATNYQVEFTVTADHATPWVTLTEAVITPQGGGSFQAVVPDPETATGFFRVRGLGASVPTVTASFNATALEVSEGGVIAPVINFSAPYFGTLRYTIGGTASSGDFRELSGELQVNGTSATIPITLEDNKMIGQLKHLTLTLQAGPGVQLGSGSETIITITENDAHWQGSFQTDNALFGFVLSIQESNGVHMASLQSEKFGFFPTTPLPVSLALTADAFSAVATDIPVPAQSTLLNLPMTQTLFLTANNGVTNQLVSASQIEGQATLISEVPDKPHLNSTTQGNFILFRPPPAPSTNEVDLVELN